ncbi:MAG: DUF3048 domain-containing protein [bacterium]
MKRKKRWWLFLYAFLILALAAGLFLVWRKKMTFNVSPGGEGENVGGQTQATNESNFEKSPISGVACENANRRPLAVMLSGDQETRPLSGLGQADIVFEMQVVEGSINRFMAVFVCESPSQIGSVRSARHDFIPLAAGLDAIYAHWGGSHFALDKLNTGIINNLDALPNPYNAFYRQSGIVAPHNGFTSMSRLVNASQRLGYRMENKFVGYPHLNESETVAHGQEKKILAVEYAGSFRVSYQYVPETNSYLRYRGGTKEIDENTGKQVEAKNIVIMRAGSQPLEGDYNDVQVEGEGKAEFYLSGQTIKGSWKKDKSDIKSRLTFLDGKGAQIKFVPGQIWVEIVDPGQAVTWK